MGINSVYIGERRFLNKMNKQGKGNTLMVVGVVALVAILGLLAYTQYSQTQLGTDGNDVTNPAVCSDSTGKLTVNAFNALQQGTNLSPTLKAGVNGGAVTTTVTSGTTTFAVGDKLVIHGALSDYLDTSIETTMKCGGVTIDMPMYNAASTNPGIRIKNDDGDFMSDNVAGAATNQTNVALGETITLDVEFQGTNLQSSGNGVYIVELPANTAANVTDVLMPGAEKLNYVPSVHTTLNAGSKVVAFKIPAVVGAEKKTYALSIVLGAGKDISGGVYTDWYAEEAFIDDDGTVKTGIQDSTGDAKYENNVDFDFYINAA